MIHPPDPCTNPASTHIFSHALVIYNGINSMNFIGLILSIDIHQHYLATGKSAGDTLTYRRAFSMNIFLGLVSCLSFFSSLLLLFSA